MAESIRKTKKKKAGFAPSKLRKLAERFGYTEIDFNDVSKVLGFRKETIRINVYYTTQTVGTCLNHPKRGKSQLFRRDVNWKQLENIFENPRRHTGKGYYHHRKTQGQQWKCNNEENDTFECDSARRWRYVTMATDLEPREDMIREICSFCSRADALYWNPGDAPMLNKTRYSCGSRAAMTAMLMGEAKRMYGDDIEIYSLNDITNRDELEALPYGNCCNMDAFLEEHRTDLHHLQVKLRRFSKDVRTELILWFISRDHCGYHLFQRDLEPIKTSTSDAVVQTHIEYGKMMYPKSWNFCNAHGVAYS